MPEPVLEDTNASALAKLLDRQSGDVWYRPSVRETVDLTKSAVMLVPKSATEPIVHDRAAVLTTMGVFGDTASITIDPRNPAAPGYTAYVHAGKRRKVPKGVVVAFFRNALHNPAAEPRVASKPKAKAGKGASSVAADALSAFLDEQEEEPTTGAGAEPPELVLDDVDPLADADGVAAPPPVRVDKRCRTEAPLAAVPFAAATTSGVAPYDHITVDDVVWHRPHPHVLCTVMPAIGADRSPQLARPGTHIAGFGIDGTLIKTDLFKRGRSAFELCHPAVPTNLTLLHKEGFRIVLFASYSLLHRASRAVVEERLGRLAAFHRDALGGAVPLTVVLSTVSRLQPSEFTMPNAGLWKLFCSRLCTQAAQPLLQFASFVGHLGADVDAGESGTPDTVDRDFAKACGVAYVSPQDFFDKNMPAFC